MPRTLLEVVLATPVGPIRVMTTHLEYYSTRQRQAQVERIRLLHEEACARSALIGKRDSSDSPYHAYGYPARTLLTGDFNFRPEDPLRFHVQEPFNGDAPRLIDIWEHLHPDIPHPHTVGIHDRQQRPQSFTCDYIFASEDLLPRVSALRVDNQSQASDHQPQMVELE
jgi:endonuclease/exonuclease/phosphatase family metal-dependent hydrolase